MKVLTIGAATQDLFLEYTNPETMVFDVDGREKPYIILQEGEKVELDDVLKHTGGGATNSACSFKKLGFTVAPCCKVGNDESGKFVVKKLKEKKINTAYVSKTIKAPTGNSYILPSHTGNKSLLVHRGANLQLTSRDIPHKAIKNCDQLYITSLSKQTSKLLPLISKVAKKYKKPVASNPGTSQLSANVQTLEKSLQYIDILILNCLEATLLMDHMAPKPKNQKILKPNKSLPDLLAAPIARGTISFTLQQYFHEILKRGPQLVVVTNGADGVYVTDGKQIYYHPSLPIYIVSTVGAGDAFGSTFVAQLARGKSIENALLAGIINSAAILEYQDATTGLLPQKKLDKLVKEIDQKGIKTFPLTN